MRAAAMASQASLPGCFFGKRKLHLGWDSSNEGIQRLSILVVVDIAVPNCFTLVPHLEPYPHHRGPLNVVGLGEGRPPTVGTTRAASVVAAAASTSALAAASFAIASLAALAAVTAVSATARSRSSAAATSWRPSAETILRTWRASGGLLCWEEVASDELLLVCAGEEG
jgi:hypothetical protein